MRRIKDYGLEIMVKIEILWANEIKKKRLVLDAKSLFEKSYIYRLSK